MPQLENKRLFIAVGLPESTRSHLNNIQSELKKSGADAKWVEHENIHLTIKFLGSIDAQNEKKISALLTKLFSQQESFDAALNQLSCFPANHSPRVIWAGFKDEGDKIRKMAERLEKELSKMGIEKEERDFQTHVTLARIRSPKNKPALIEKLNTLSQNFKSEITRIDNITLFKSHLSPKGPAYSVIHQVKFL